MHANELKKYFDEQECHVLLLRDHMLSIQSGNLKK